MTICTGYRTSSDKKHGHIHEEIVTNDPLHCPLCAALEEIEQLQYQVDRLKWAADSERP